MTNKDAVAVISTSLEVLTYRHFRGKHSTDGLPVGLIRQALALIEERPPFS